MKHYLSKLMVTIFIIGTIACNSENNIPEKIEKGENKEIINVQKELDWGTDQISGEFNELPVESEFTTTKLWETTSEGNHAFNHFSRLYEYDGRLYAMWMSHNYDEHGPGQTLRWTYSDDFGTTWSPVSYLFDPMDDIDVSFFTRNGRYMNPVGIAKLSDGLYAVAEVMDHPEQHMEPVGAIIRKINPDATLGEPFWGWTNAGDKIAPTPVTGYPAYPFNEAKWTDIKKWFTTPGNRPASHGATSKELESRVYIDQTTFEHYYDRAGQFTEQSEAPNNNGQYVRIWRAFYEPGNYRIQRNLFAQYSNDGINYNSPPVITNLPSSRALHTIRNIDGNFVVMGNPKNSDVTNINRDPLYMYIFDPSTMLVEPQNIYTLRSNGSDFRFEGAYKGGIFSYPHFLKMSNGKIGVVYTTFGKEDIEFSSFYLPELR